ncbi:CAAX prenyl protease [Coelomomyces lativittatus]|nr:CAAX prenyl protease [Coelomomyces lativittatus]KAJ1515290.1 CAAX prenyl protease [Coelomomyces lativittatus]KAJ1518459.1 CAAX prenyl protease [Coelomomyces lativittatus]
MYSLLRKPIKAYPIWILSGWGLFSGTHLFLSHPPIRKKIIDEYCKGKTSTFLALYSAISLATFGPTTLLYMHYRRALSHGAYNGIPLWQVSWKKSALGTLIKISALYTLFESITTPSPVIVTVPPSPHDGFQGLPESNAVPHGIHRITRHPTFFSFALLGLGQLFTRGLLPDVAFWAPFPIFWVIGSLHQDFRLKNESHPSTGKPRFSKEYLDKTSLLPFGAVLKGKQDLREIIQEINVKHLAMAIFSWIWWL